MFSAILPRFREDRTQINVKTKTGKAKNPGKPCGKAFIAAVKRCNKHYTNGKLNAEGRKQRKEHAARVKAVKGMASRRKATKPTPESESVKFLATNKTAKTLSDKSKAKLLQFPEWLIPKHGTIEIFKSYENKTPIKSETHAGEAIVTRINKPSKTNPYGTARLKSIEYGDSITVSFVLLSDRLNQQKEFVEGDAPVSRAEKERFERLGLERRSSSVWGRSRRKKEKTAAM